MANKVTKTIPTLPKTTHERIQYLRIKTGEKQEDIAEKILNVSRVNYGYYENNQRSIPIEAIKKLAEHYNVSSDFLLCLTNDETPDTSFIAINKKIGLSGDAMKVLEQAQNSGDKHTIAIINKLLEEKLNNKKPVLDYMVRYYKFNPEHDYKAIPLAGYKDLKEVSLRLEAEDIDSLYLMELQNSHKEHKKQLLKD